MSQRESVSTSSINAPEVRVDRIAGRHLLVEIAPEHLDVTRLVDHLRRRVVLGVDPRHGLDDARGTQQRALLAVEELARAVREVLHRVLHELLLAPLRDRRAGFVDERAHVLHAPVVLRELDGGAFGIDVGRPVEVGRAVPLRGLRLLVELVERGPLALGVVPRERRVEAECDGVQERVVVGVDLRQDGLEVVVRSDFPHATDASTGARCCR